MGVVIFSRKRWRGNKTSLLFRLPPPIGFCVSIVREIVVVPAVAGDDGFEHDEGADLLDA